MTKKILYIDDEPYFVRSLTEALEDEGYEVKRVVNGSEALAELKRYTPDLIILDIIMPTGPNLVDQNGGRRTGQRVHEAIRRELALKTPIVFVTVIEDPVVHGAIRRLDQDYGIEQPAVLVKPVLPTELIQQVRDIIGEPD